MYKIGEIIVYHDGKIYQVIDLVEKDYGRGPQLYYFLQQSELYKDNKVTNVYVPQSGLEGKSRPITKKKKVLELINSIEEIEPIWIKESKKRRTEFYEICLKRDPLDSLKLIKSLVARAEELEKDNKTITITDKRMLDKLVEDILIEFSFSLKITPEEVKNLFKEHNLILK